MGYWIINTAGVGGLIVVGVAIIVLLAYVRMVYWVLAGRSAEGEGDAPR